MGTGGVTECKLSQARLHKCLFLLSIMGENRVNIDVPRYDQSTYWGRASHFFSTTNPLNLFATPTALKQAGDVVNRYRKGEDVGLSEEELWKNKQLYDSAFHPDTGELVLLPGRMAFQVPGNMFITGMMMTFYKTTPQVAFWQWFNQTFNSYVNYSNRSGSTPIAKSTLITSYVAATGGALGTAEGTFFGKSKIAARQGISMVVLSRIGMAAPSMMCIPFFMNYLEKRGVLAKYPRISAPLQVGICGIILTFATPMCCAIFEQRASIAVSSCE